MQQSEPEVAGAVSRSAHPDQPQRQSKCGLHGEVRPCGTCDRIAQRLLDQRSARIVG